MIAINDIKKGHYVVVQRQNEDGSRQKPELIKVTTIREDILAVIGRLEKNAHLTETTVEAKESEILVDLGRKPRPGKVYGYDLAKLYRGSKDHDVFGEIHFFTTPDEKNMASFWKGLDRASILLKKNGLGFLIDKSKFVFEVTPKKGKYAGMYHHSSNPEKKLPKLQLSVGDETIQSASVGNYSYVVLHEMAHVLDFQFLHDYPEINSGWLNLYTTSIGPRAVTKDRAQELLQALIKSGDTLRAFFADLDEDGRSDLKLVLKWIREIKNVTSNDVATLLASRSDRSIAVLQETWPNVHVRSKKLQPIVTDYACKSRRELFAESVALYLLGKEIPAKVLKLVEASISQARGFAKGME